MNMRVIWLFYRPSKIVSYSLILENMSFGCYPFAFLGHIISSEGIYVDSQKIETVKEWTKPTSSIDVRSF